MNRRLLRLPLVTSERMHKGEPVQVPNANGFSLVNAFDSNRVRIINQLELPYIYKAAARKQEKKSRRNRAQALRGAALTH